MSASALPCPSCGRPPKWDDGMVYCQNCYDADCVGDPPRFVSTSPYGLGDTEAEAVGSWNEAVES